MMRGPLLPTVTTETKLEADGTLVVERWQDVEPIIERNKQLQNIEQKSDWGRHVASIPNIFYERWFNEEYARGNVDLKMFGREMDKIVAKKLKDPDWKWLRTDK
jgi:hypothetical protein